MGRAYDFEDTSGNAILPVGGGPYYTADMSDAYTNGHVFLIFYDTDGETVVTPSGGTVVFKSAALGEQYLDAASGGTVDATTVGTAIPISNWNLKTPQATTVVSALSSVTTTTDGTAAQSPEYFFGASATGQRTPDAIPEGYERVIAPNSEFLVTITNNGSNSARCEYSLSWHEGDISTEIP